VCVNDILDPAKIDAAEPAMETFGVNVHHELRTPINAIVGYVEMMLEDAAERGQEGLRPDLQKIHSAALRFLAFSDDIVNFSKH
jgi:signal transduction histidine kinase